MTSFTEEGYSRLRGILVIILCQPRLLLLMMSLNQNLISLRCLFKEITFLRIVMVESSFNAALIILLYDRRRIVTLRYNAGLFASQSLDGLTVNYLAVCRSQLRLDVCRGVHFIHQYQRCWFLSNTHTLPSRFHVWKLVIVLFLYQNLRCDNNAHTIRVNTVIVNQLNLLHHRCYIIVALLAMMCGRF